MKILITGSTGLIGSALLKRIKTIPRLKFVLVNRTPENDYLGILHKNYLADRLNGVKGIIHLAGISSVGEAEKNPQYSWEVNVKGLQNVLTSISKLDIKPWFIYPSSREVYGCNNKTPFTEESHISPCNQYGYQKVVCENILRSFNNINTSILRFSSVYGSIHDKHSRVIPAYCRNAIHNIPLKCNGPKNVLDFTHVNDIVDGIIKVMHALEKGHAVTVLNLMNGHGISLYQLAKKVILIAKSHSKIDIKTADNFHQNTFIGSYRKAQQLINWAPTISLEVGLKRLINDLVQHEGVPYEDTQSYSRVSNALQRWIRSI